ncbi:hypothetical protein [Streptomyces noursei]|uniref:hypothetical protein n=1 Tax=Streptomyces noursei TaxID=1971 RepID=UPI0023B7A996|nr:hypothetical protein [Streptomyces noursei]
MADLQWARATGQAREATGYAGEDIPRSVEAVRERLRADLRQELDQELGALDGGGAFAAWLNHWWTQALADAALDDEAREAAIGFADVAVALHVRA